MALDNEAPTPSEKSDQLVAVTEPKKDNSMLDTKNPSAVSVTLVGCGGCGINLARPFYQDKKFFKTLYFDTSMTNTRHGEVATIISDGSGSGSNRSENAAKIDRLIPQLSEENMGLSDVAVLMFSLGGGSGSVIGPLLMREYARRKMRVIAVVVADTSSSVGATNNLNTLKTMTAICKNNDLYVPTIVLSNDQAPGRVAVNETATMLIADLVDLLTQPVFEVDRNDRLNWIDPTKVTSSQPGIKMLKLFSDARKLDSKIVLGMDSEEMVDSLMILQDHDAMEIGGTELPPSRLKKVGFFYENHARLIGSVSSDITSIEKIIDYVDRMQNQERSQKHQTVDRLHDSGSTDLIL